MDTEFIYSGGNIANIRCGCGEVMWIDIYNFKECPKCGKKYKFRHANILMEED